MFYKFEELIEHIMITNGNGSVVFTIGKMFYVTDAFGQNLKSFVLDAKIVLWKNALNTKKEDFVLFIDDKFNLGVIPVDEPEKKMVIKKHMFCALALGYSNGYVCVVQCDGNLEMIPMDLDNIESSPSSE
ncbi:hypothetical protein GPJ56_007107 [Histomonas meleagridis]|uniref:uncharacterized protein n=1 Tax=Histomonas meleagridis TaxID=135588 RepID=UPI00355A5306|nr:hypothetical protein GPJ56_007107 [Histomonas meleagridis]KAH0796098.1 hypothetical protein GO595_011065 [Histomonas meleagridis]